jgi:hypothetical protein
VSPLLPAVHKPLGFQIWGSDALPPVPAFWEYAPYVTTRLTIPLFVLQIASEDKVNTVAMSIARKSSLSLSSSKGSSNSRLATLAELSHSMPQIPPITRDFEPCAATASMFLYAQGSSVVCCHHDTLTIERRFSRHTEEIQLLAVDTVSERGTGRQVVSYDAGQTAIVWDCMTGDEIARFASYENLTVAAWMRNGNVAFGRRWDQVFRTSC